MIKGINHVGISVADLDRSIAFYRDMFGMEQVASVYPFGGPLFDRVMQIDDVAGKVGAVRKGNFQLELFEFTRPRAAPKDPDYPVSDQGISHFCIEVEDIAASYARLSAAGVRFHCDVLAFDSGIKATYGRDPDGNVFELLELPQATAS